MKRWKEFESTEMSALNGSLRQAHVPEIKPHAEFTQEDSDVDLE
jgi:hypothetical protein